jgi:hypothetical protein
VTSHRVPDARRLAAAFALTLFIAIMMPMGSLGAAPKVRTDTGGLPGYIIKGTASPLSMLMYEPVIPVPVDPGEPHGEGSLSYTLTTLETGPQARALASSVWPGAAVGDGFSTLCECDENYRVKSESTYPGREAQQTDTQGSKETGSGMFTEALGLDVIARASSAESPNAEAMGLGNAWSRNESTVRNGRAISSVVSAAEDVSIGGGVITIDSVKTVLDAFSDGKKASSSGVTEVNGLTIGGQGYTVDEKGIRPVQDDKPQDAPATLPPMPGAKELYDQAGIKVVLTEHEKTSRKDQYGAEATRQAGGLRISIETAVLKAALVENLPVNDILDSVPDDLDPVIAQFAQLRALAPRIDFVFARGAVKATGSAELEFPTPPPPPPPPPPPTDTGGTDTTPPPPPADTTPDEGSAAPPLSGGSTPPASGGSGLAPVSAPAAPAAPTTPASVQIPLTQGLPAALVGAGLLLAGLGGRALAGLSGMAMGGATGAFCDRGSPRNVPNLRS